MKLVTLLMIMAALQITLYIFGEGLSETPLWLLITTPFDWSALGLINFFQLAAGGVFTGIAIVGTLIFGKNDLAVFGGAVAVFIGCCFPITTLWGVIAREIGYFGESAWLISTVICAPLIILSMITIINWWRSASDIS